MITTKKRNLNRLLKLARHVGKLYLKKTFIGGIHDDYFEKEDCNIEHFSYVLSELPMIFKQWTYRDGIPKLKGYEKLSSLAATAVFFNLNGDELFHLFVPGYQAPIYQGKDLFDWSNPGDVVDNIYQFILYKEGLLTNPVEIETEKYKNLLKNKFYYDYPELSTKVYPLSA